ncbi:MAG: DUF3868 domain-containing protein [Prevotella sp.]|nr:DUF3868 domain-containing protein [Prevotella sp.]
MKRTFIIALLVALVTTAMAQKTIQLVDTKKGTDNQLSVERYEVKRTDNKTYVSMDFVLDRLRVPSNRYRAFTPIIRSKDGQQKTRLKTLIVSGRTQDIVFERDGIDPLYADNCVNIRRQNGEAQRYAYADAIDVQPWHKGADILMECDLCGCGDTLRSQLAYLSTLPNDPVYNIVNLTPDPYKAPRSLHGTAYITFVVDRWEMKPDYMNNRHELRKITDTLDIMVADEHIHVSQIKIHGWASPESPYEHNRMLATNRAKSLTDYVRNLYGLPANVFAAPEATPENWQGLRAAVEDMDYATLPHKLEIMSIIDDNTLAPDPKEAKIKKLYPQEYRYLLKEIYPGLRRSDYEIQFRIDDFTLAEACQIIKTKPYQLSLYEMWQVANTFEPNSDDYIRTLQIAVDQYPDSAVAHLNLANAALNRHDLLKAEMELEKAGDSAEALNARAVLLMMREQWDEAEAMLRRAEEKGIDVTVNRQTIADQR